MIMILYFHRNEFLNLIILEENMVSFFCCSLFLKKEFKSFWTLLNGSSFYFFTAGAGIEIAKAMFGIISGIEIGPVRLPIMKLTAEKYNMLKKDIAAFGSAE